MRDAKTLNLFHNIVSLQVLGRCFAFFTLRDQLVAQQKHLLRVKGMQRADWLICLITSKFVVWQVVSLLKNEQQSQNLLLKVDPRSTFRNNFLVVVVVVVSPALKRILFKWNYYNWLLIAPEKLRWGGPFFGQSVVRDAKENRAKKMATQNPRRFLSPHTRRTKWKRDYSQS